MSWVKKKGYGNLVKDFNPKDWVFIFTSPAAEHAFWTVINFIKDARKSDLYDGWASGRLPDDIYKTGNGFHLFWD